jgi:hypothetical protein
MSEPADTLAVYRVKAGTEDASVSARERLAEKSSSLPQPPLRGTLIRHRSDRMLFYPFGPWRSAEHVAAVRESPEAGEAFRRPRELCDELTPGDYELVTHVDVEGGSRQRLNQSRKTGASAPDSYMHPMPLRGVSHARCIGARRQGFEVR